MNSRLTPTRFLPLFPDPTTMVELWKDSPQGFVKEGDTVELRCQGDGNPPPSFIFNREQVRERESERVVTFGRHVGMFFICRTLRILTRPCRLWKD